MPIGYARVSKRDEEQFLDVQREALLDAGVPVDRIYLDRTCRCANLRRGLDDCLNALQSGDTLVVLTLDRFGRDLQRLAALVGDLKACEVELHVLDGVGEELFATSFGKVRQAISRFHVEAGRYKNCLPRSFANFRRWYACRNDGGQWLFGPSKVVGYEGMEFSAYRRLQTVSNCLNGIDAENHLHGSGWFRELRYDSPRPERHEFERLAPCLEEFLEEFDSRPWGQGEDYPHGQVSINVPKDDQS